MTLIQSYRYSNIIFSFCPSFLTSVIFYFLILLCKVAVQLSYHHIAKFYGVCSFVSKSGTDFSILVCVCVVVTNIFALPCIEKTVTEL